MAQTPHDMSMTFHPLTVEQEAAAARLVRRSCRDAALILEALGLEQAP